MAQGIRAIREPASRQPADYLSRAEVAAIFGVAPSTVTRWADEGKLVCVRTLGGHRRYDRESVGKLVRMLTKEETGVEKVTLEIPRLYGDHHTSTVRQAVAQLAGIDSVWASAAQHKVQITFDPAVIDRAKIAAHLAKAGYPTRDDTETGAASGASPGVHKDPAWAELGLRMTDTYAGVKA